jgi:hypothetical protein
MSQKTTLDWADFQGRGAVVARSSQKENGRPLEGAGRDDRVLSSAR